MKVEVRQERWMKGTMADVHPSVEIGEDSYVWSFAVICEGVKIGRHCVVGSGVFIGRNCVIGDNVRIQDKAFVVDHMVIADDVFIGPHAVMTNDKYPVSGNNPGYKIEPPILEKGCSLGANCTILPGVRVGRYAMIGAGAVVTKDVLPWGIVKGGYAT